MSKPIPIDTSNGNNLNINRISSGTTIVGTIETSGDLRIDGRVEGTITSAGRVIIGETGFVKGDLTAKLLDVMGQFEGTIVVSEATVLKATAVVTGRIRPAKLSVESGAKLNGTCEMGEAEHGRLATTITGKNIEEEEAA